MEESQTATEEEKSAPTNEREWLLYCDDLATNRSGHKKYQAIINVCAAIYDLNLFAG